MAEPSCSFCGASLSEAGSLIRAKRDSAIAICPGCIGHFAAELDARGSFSLAISELRRRRENGDTIPMTGYFGRTQE